MFYFVTLSPGHYVYEGEREREGERDDQQL